MVRNNYTKTVLASFIFAFTGMPYAADAQEADFSADAMFMAQEGLGTLNANEGDDLFALLDKAPTANAQDAQKPADKPATPAPAAKDAAIAAPAAKDAAAPKAPEAKEVPPMFPDEAKPAATDAPKSAALPEKDVAAPATAAPATAAANTETATAEKTADAAKNPASGFADVDIFSEELSFPEVSGTATAAPAAATSKTSPSEQLLGTVDADIFREMAAIERENALLTLRAKREKLISELESAKAQQRKNQLDELERREEITRNRINWEIEQETAALEREKEKEREKLLGPTLPNGETEDDITIIYKVEEVRGVDGSLYAVLIYDQGSKLTVREGYVLKNGYTVSKINTTVVEVKRGEETALLAFANKNDVDSGSSSMGIR